MSDTANQDSATAARAARTQQQVQAANDLIDRLANPRGDIGVAFPRNVAKYLPQYLGDDSKPAFYVPGPKGIVSASGDNIDRLVAKRERETGVAVDELRWGSNSVLKRGENGKFGDAKFNIFAVHNEPLMAQAAYKTLYDGRTENGRARQFLVANGEHLHNRCGNRPPTVRAFRLVEKQGLGSLSRSKDGPSYVAFIAARRPEEGGGRAAGRRADAGDGSVRREPALHGNPRSDADQERRSRDLRVTPLEQVDGRASVRPFSFARFAFVW